MVGDPRQTIYSFTGATPDYLTGFAAEYPHATVVRLVRNYRSTPEVVALRQPAGRDDRQPGAGWVAAAGPAQRRAAGQRAPEFTEYARRGRRGGGGRRPGAAV